MKNIKIAMLQADIVWENHEQNLRNFAEKIHGLDEPDIVVLPEMFTTGFSMSPTSVAQTMSGESVAWMRETALGKSTHLVGSLVIKDEGLYYNRLIWAKPNGGLEYYDKKHLFRFAGEDEFYQAGNEHLIVNVHGWKIAAFICYDLRFPVWSRNKNLHYDAALYVANWPAKRRHHWRSLLVARAIENQAYIMGVNCVGVDGNGVAYSGDSMLIDPLGETLFHQADEEANHMHELSATHLAQTRRKFPFLNDADAFRLE